MQGIERIQSVLRRHTLRYLDDALDRFRPVGYSGEERFEQRDLCTVPVVGGFRQHLESQERTRNEYTLWVIDEHYRTLS